MLKAAFTQNSLHCNATVYQLSLIQYQSSGCSFWLHMKLARAPSGTSYLQQIGREGKESQVLTISLSPHSLVLLVNLDSWLTGACLR